MEKEKIPKQKLHTSFNKRQSVAKNPEGENDNGQEKCLKFYFTGGKMTKGGGVIWQRVLRYFGDARFKFRFSKDQVNN